MPHTPLVCVGHTRPIPCLAFSDNVEEGHSYIISACLDKTAMIRDGASGDWIGTFVGHKGAVWSAAFNLDATLAATGSADYTAKLWDAITGDELATFEHKRIVRSVDITKAVGAGTPRLLTGGQEKLLRVYDLEKPQSGPVQVLAGHNESIRTALWCYHDPNICVSISGAPENALRVWDTRADQSLVKELTLPGKEALSDLEVSRDGRTIATASPGKATLFSIATLTAECTLAVPATAETISVNPRGSRLLAGGGDFWVHMYDTSTGSELETYKGHHGPVHCVRFDSLGESFASGSEDGTVRVYVRSKEGDGASL